MGLLTQEAWAALRALLTPGVEEEQKAVLRAFGEAIAQAHGPEAARLALSALPAVIAAFRYPLPQGAMYALWDEELGRWAIYRPLPTGRLGPFEGWAVPLKEGEDV